MLNMAVKPKGVINPKTRTTRAASSNLTLEQVQKNRIREVENNPNKKSRGKHKKRLLWELESKAENYIRSQVKRSRTNYFSEGAGLVLAEFSILTGVSSSVLNNIENGNHRLNNSDNMDQILSILLNAPSGIIPRMPDGRPMHSSYLPEFKTLADPNEVVKDKDGNEITRKELFLRYGVKYPNKDFLTMTSDTKGLDSHQLDNEDENSDSYESHLSPDAQERTDRLIGLFADYGEVHKDDRSMPFYGLDPDSIDYWTALADHLSETTEILPEVIHGLINQAIDPLGISWLTSNKLAAVLPKDGNPELTWYAHDFIEYITCRKFRSGGRSNKITITLRDLTVE